MTKTLSQIISDGTLVDNSVYQAETGVFRAGSFGPSVEIRQGGRGPNNPLTGWSLIHKAATLNTENSKLVFRVPDADYEHNTDDAFISVVGADPLNFNLATGNLIGCVKSEGYTLRVTSRFGDEFLKYIIADADGFVELPDQGGMERGGYEWLLVYLWLVKLKKAFRLGLPKAYETRSESLTQVRGRLDPVDYFLNQQRARYRCTYREHSYDNDTTRLIARTLQHLDSHDFLRESHVLNQTFQIATQGRRSTLQNLLATLPVRNPYYADYNPVITLSKQIMRDELSDFGDQSETSAFFFDVSMLFEYFMRKLLKQAGMVFHEKSGRHWQIPSGLRNDFRKLIPDLVFDVNSGTYVFDVKYKRFDFAYGVSREDLFQIHTYIGQVSNEHNVAGCGFIYPIRESRWHECGLEATRGIFSETITQGSRTIPFHVVFLKIPEQGKNVPNNQWPKMFRNFFQQNTAELIRNLLECLSNDSKMQQLVGVSSLPPVKI
jgi:5-methylcytosine-specific restriction enzyme subunit McrC